MISKRLDKSLRHGTKKTVICAHCGSLVEKFTRSINEAAKKGMKLYCNRKCSSLAKVGKNKFTHDSWRRVSETRVSKGNPNWKDSDATTGSIHSWVRFNWVRPDKCEICGYPNDGTRTFDWSNKNHKYSRNRDEWQSVCRSCHTIYDVKHNGRVLSHTKKNAETRKKLLQSIWL